MYRHSDTEKSERSLEMEGPDCLEVSRNFTKRASREDIFSLFSSLSGASGDIAAGAGKYQNAMYGPLDKTLPAHRRKPEGTAEVVYWKEGGARLIGRNGER